MNHKQEMLRSGVITLPGGRDRAGHWLLVFDSTHAQYNTAAIMTLTQHCMLTLTPGCLPCATFSALLHLTSATKQSATAIVQALLQVQIGDPESIRALYVLMPRQKDLHKHVHKLFSKARADRATGLLKIHECDAASDLDRYIDVTQRTPQLGGRSEYDHTRFTEFYASVADLNANFSALRHQLPENKNQLVQRLEQALCTDSANTQAQLHDIESAYTKCIQELKLEKILEECAHIHDKGAWSGVTATPFYSHSIEEADRQEAELNAIKAELKALWEEARGHLMQSNRMQKYCGKAEKVLQWMDDIGMPTVKKKTDVADCLSKAERDLNHFETGFYSIATNVLELSERILRKLENNQNNGSQSHIEADVTSHAKRLHDCFAQFKSLVETKRQMYVDVRNFHSCWQELSKWCKNILQLLPLHLLTLIKVQGQNHVRVTQNWVISLQDLHKQNPSPHVSFLHTFKGNIHLMDCEDVRNQAMQLVHRVEVLREVLAKSDACSQSQLVEISQWRAALEEENQRNHDVTAISQWDSIITLNNSIIGEMFLDQTLFDSNETVVAENRPKFSPKPIQNDAPLAVLGKPKLKAERVSSLLDLNRHDDITTPTSTQVRSQMPLSEKNHLGTSGAFTPFGSIQDLSKLSNKKLKQQRLGKSNSKSLECLSFVNEETETTKKPPEKPDRKKRRKTVTISEQVHVHSDRSNIANPITPTTTTLRPSLKQKTSSVQDINCLYSSNSESENSPAILPHSGTQLEQSPMCLQTGNGATTGVVPPLDLSFLHSTYSDADASCLDSSGFLARQQSYKVYGEPRKRVANSTRPSQSTRSAHSSRHPNSPMHFASTRSVPHGNGFNNLTTQMNFGSLLGDQLNKGHLENVQVNDYCSDTTANCGPIKLVPKITPVLKSRTSATVTHTQNCPTSSTYVRSNHSSNIDSNFTPNKVTANNVVSHSVSLEPEFESKHSATPKHLMSPSHTSLESSDGNTIESMCVSSSTLSFPKNENNEKQNSVNSSSDGNLNFTRENFEALLNSTLSAEEKLKMAELMFKATRTENEPRVNHNLQSSETETDHPSENELRKTVTHLSRTDAKHSNDTQGEHISNQDDKSRPQKSKKKPPRRRINKTTEKHEGKHDQSSSHVRSKAKLEKRLQGCTDLIFENETRDRQNNVSSEMLAGSPDIQKPAGLTPQHAEITYGIDVQGWVNSQVVGDELDSPNQPGEQAEIHDQPAESVVTQKQENTRMRAAIESEALRQRRVEDTLRRTERILREEEELMDREKGRDGAKVGDNTSPESGVFTPTSQLSPITSRPATQTDTQIFPRSATKAPTREETRPEMVSPNVKEQSTFKSSFVKERFPLKPKSRPNSSRSPTSASLEQFKQAMSEKIQKLKKTSSGASDVSNIRHKKRAGANSDSTKKGSDDSNSQNNYFTLAQLDRSKIWYDYDPEIDASNRSSPVESVASLTISRNSFSKIDRRPFHENDRLQHEPNLQKTDSKVQKHDIKEKSSKHSKPAIQNQNSSNGSSNVSKTDDARKATVVKIFPNENINLEQEVETEPEAEQVQTPHFSDDLGYASQQNSPKKVLCSHRSLSDQERQALDERYERLVGAHMLSKPEEEPTGAPVSQVQSSAAKTKDEVPSASMLSKERSDMMKSRRNGYDSAKEEIDAAVSNHDKDIFSEVHSPESQARNCNFAAPSTVNSTQSQTKSNAKDLCIPSDNDTKIDEKVKPHDKIVKPQVKNNETVQKIPVQKDGRSNSCDVHDDILKSLHIAESVLDSELDNGTEMKSGNEFALQSSVGSDELIKKLAANEESFCKFLGALMDKNDLKSPNGKQVPHFVTKGYEVGHEEGGANDDNIIVSPVIDLDENPFNQSKTKQMSQPKDYVKPVDVVEKQSAPFEITERLPLTPVRQNSSTSNTLLHLVHNNLDTKRSESGDRNGMTKTKLDFSVDEIAALKMSSNAPNQVKRTNSDRSHLSMNKGSRILDGKLKRNESLDDERTNRYNSCNPRETSDKHSVVSPNRSLNGKGISAKHAQKANQLLEKLHARMQSKQHAPGSNINSISKEMVGEKSKKDDTLRLNGIVGHISEKHTANLPSVGRATPKDPSAKNAQNVYQPDAKKVTSVAESEKLDLKKEELKSTIITDDKRITDTDGSREVDVNKDDLTFNKMSDVKVVRSKASHNHSDNVGLKVDTHPVAINNTDAISSVPKHAFKPPPLADFTDLDDIAPRPFSIQAYQLEPQASSLDSPRSSEGSQDTSMSSMLDQLEVYGLDSQRSEGEISEDESSNGLDTIAEASSEDEASWHDEESSVNKTLDADENTADDTSQTEPLTDQGSIRIQGLSTQEFEQVILEANVAKINAGDGTDTEAEESSMRSDEDDLETRTEVSDSENLSTPRTLGLLSTPRTLGLLSTPRLLETSQILDLKTAIVLDTGSGYIKCGFADADAPSCIFPAYVGRPKYEQALSNSYRDAYIGSEAQSMRGVLKLNYPVQNGVVSNWDDMQRIWEHAVRDGLRADSSEHPLLLTEAPLSAPAHRQRVLELAFESMHVPAAYLAVQAVCALYATGRTTGVVFDSGDDISDIVPVYEGCALPHATQRLHLAGRHLTQYLVKLFRESGVNLQSTAEVDIASRIKEKHCYVATDYVQELSRVDRYDATLEQHYTLPDGHQVSLASERFRCPEALFQPRVLGRDHEGVHASVYASVNKTNDDIRHELLSNIVLCGGTTQLPGFAERLETELRSLCANSYAASVRVHSPPEPDLLAWRGGAVLANMSTFGTQWVSQAEYQEYGSSIVHRKCF